MKRKVALIAREQILRTILLIRKKKVILDCDLADLYGVATKVLVQAVKRNLARFPADFMFRLTVREFRSLRSQTVTSNARGGRRTPPYAFTEEGVAMLSGILHSRRAIAANIEIMRAFVRLREIVKEHRDLAKKIDVLEKRCDANFEVVFDVLRELMPRETAAKPQRRIGYLTAGAAVT
jgi:hypothetical protein